MKATEVESKWDRNCPSWHSLLGAGWEFGSAHCIISISPNLPPQMETASTCSMSCIIKFLPLYSWCLLYKVHTNKMQIQIQTYCTYCMCTKSLSSNPPVFTQTVLEGNNGWSCCLLVGDSWLKPAHWLAPFCVELVCSPWGRLCCL